jgi:Putative MetA-pathway of phenol degradation
VNRARLLTSIFAALCYSNACAQQPFYTDDPGVTDRGKFHFELANEFDVLQTSLYPSLRQNTLNYRFNYGLPWHLEIDVDSPYLGIFRTNAAQTKRSFGPGDTNLGLKWSFHEEKDGSKAPALATSFYVEFPTGDNHNQLGSGLVDYWLNGIAQKQIGHATRVTANAGILFAGNTSTGLVGIQTTHGRVFTAGLSVIRKMTPRLELGAELYGGVTGNLDLGKSQLQGLIGGKYELRKGLTLDFGILGGKFIASPRAGAQLGFSVDFP